MKLAKILFYLIFLNLININSYSNEKIEIKFKVGDQIITNIDIINEKKYLIFLRPELKNLSEVDIIKLSENSIIREVIKKKELKKIFKKYNNEKLLNDIKNNLIRFKKVKNEDELKLLIESNNINYSNIIEKMKYENLWNELIFKNFSPLIKINKKKLREELVIKMSKNKKKEYNLSEILFEIDSSNQMKNKYDEISKLIKTKDFETAAYKYSISNSSTNGGQIGWVKETLLSKKLNKILGKMQIGSLSKPLKYPNGYLIIKINNIREIKKETDIDNELKELINFESNKQLNQFSLLFYKKLKQNSKINEY
tara:strand:+ start:1218 stop:2150 length:933 start_codon:yes stop_codon:yes gene_type:complete